MNKYLEKIAAEKKNEMRKHQTDALAQLDQNDGILLHHSTGSGKTKTFLKAIEKSHLGDPTNQALIIAPASLVTNIDKEIKKHKLKIDPSRLTAMSYEKAVNSVDTLRTKHFHTIVFDESHKLRNTDTKRNKYLREIAESADKRILATATGVYNTPSDIAPLVNIAAGHKILPEDKATFEKHFIESSMVDPGFINRVVLGVAPGERRDLKNTRTLKKAFDRYVHHYDSKDDPSMVDHFPTTSEKIVPVQMSKGQTQVYNFLEGQIPIHIRMKIHNGLPLNKKESANLNAFSMGVRQASNSTRPYIKEGAEYEPSQKILKAVDSLHKRFKTDKNFKGLVYSNFLNAGVNDYSEELTKRGIPHHVLTGSLSKVEKDAMVEDYNKGRKPVLVISSSGGEGLDLKGTKLTQIIEPHWNAAKIAQVKGRGARFDSHIDLPKAERHVDVEHYLSVFPEHWLWGKQNKKSIDEYMFHNSGVKDDLTQQMKELM